MERTSRIRGHELDLDALAAAEIRTGVVRFALRDDRLECLVVVARSQVEIHEPRSGDLDRLDMVEASSSKARREVVRELPGRSVRPLCDNERDVGRQITMLLPLRTLEEDLFARRDDPRRRQRRGDRVDKEVGGRHRMRACSIWQVASQHSGAVPTGCGLPLCSPRASCPRSSGDRAPASGAGCVGSNPAEGTVAVDVARLLTTGR